MPPHWIDYAFLFLTIVPYATIGGLAQSSSVAGYYVAGRPIPAVFNSIRLDKHRLLHRPGRHALPERLPGAAYVIG